jgi:plasmid stabilization system protein ParE
MAANSIILPEADQEIADAYHWYERRSPGVGKDFLRCFDAAMAAICQAPEGYAKALDDFRHLKIRRFPYTIYYEFEGSTVLVYAVYQAAQDPATLRQKLWLRKPPA